MALYKSKGIISDMSEVKSGTSQKGFEWQRMTLTLEIPGFQGSVYKQVFQVSNEDVNEVLLYNRGDKVEVTWSMYAREWNGKWYNNVELVKIAFQDGEQVSTPTLAPAPAAAPVQEELPPPSDDLPW